MALAVPGAGLGVSAFKLSAKRLSCIDGAADFVPCTRNVLHSVGSCEG